MNEEAEIITTPITSEDVEQLENIELLFFAYRDFVGDADRILDEFGFGRAHHRALYFVNRKPGMTVAELLDTLKITKQSLARVLRQLVESGYITQATGSTDKRKRLLYPTRSGRELVLALSAPLCVNYSIKITLSLTVSEKLTFFFTKMNNTNK